MLLAPSRLGIVTLLDTTRWCRVAFLRETLAVSASTLSRQLGTLRRAGYVRTERATDSTRWLRLTAAGRLRLNEHLDALRTIATGANPPVAAARQTHPEWFRQVDE
ncbi:transcriptional regulator [Amycolatopsis sp. NPDC059657]|uniref:transcriptional regulator n=1 Tax=Amycolatopsis sp. NPDC059657 TaxID=3346899 RepID=UPI003671BF73